MAESQPLFQQAEALFRSGDYAKAAPLFQQAAAQQGLDLNQMLRQGEEALAVENLDKASQLFLQVAQANPTEFQALQGLARSSLFLGMVGEAQQYIAASLKVAPEQGDNHALQGLIYEAQGDLEKAADSLRKSVEFAGGSFLTQFNLGRVEAQLGRFEEAKLALLEATKIAPDNYSAYYALGIACKESDDYDNAIRSFNRALELSPDNMDIYVTLVDILGMSGDGENAMKLLNVAMNRFGEHPALLEKASGIAMAFGAFEEAAEFNEKLVEALPDYIQAWMNLANLSIMNKDLERSEQAAKQVLEIDPNYWEAYMHLGSLYDAVGMREKAREAYLKGIDISPNYDLLNNFGSMLLEADDLATREEGVEILSEAVKLAPEGEWRGFYNLALGYASLDKKARARELLATFKDQLDPESDLGQKVQTLDQNLLSESDKIKLTISQWKV